MMKEKIAQGLKTLIQMDILQIYIKNIYDQKLSDWLKSCI